MLGASADGDATLRVAPVTTANIPRTPAGTELHLGSQDLVRLAAYASSEGYVTSSFMIADAYLVPLPADEQADVSCDLVSLLKEYGEEEVGAALHNEFDGLYVVGVELIDSESGMRISIRRRGYIETSVEREAEQLLRAAWQELHLS